MSVIVSMSIDTADEEVVTDEELTALALAADPEAPIADDAVPFGSGDPTFPSLVPAWYMPVPMRWHHDRRSRIAAYLIIGSLLLISGLGLCITYGHLEIAF